MKNDVVFMNCYVLVMLLDECYQVNSSHFH